MKTTLAIAIAAIGLAGCASKPVQPDWKTNAAGSLKAFSDAWLKGDTGVADTEFSRARLEMSSTGRFGLVAHAELYRCATRAAGLDYDDCPGFRALAQDAGAAERAYAAYIAGQWQGLDTALLPEQHRAVAQGRGALSAIADPLSRMVAAGAMMKAGRIGPPDIAVATDTASEQGWRRPLLAWLGLSLRRAASAGDTEAAARIRRRIDLVSTQSD